MNEIVKVLNSLVTADKIERWEEFALEQPQVEIKLTETFVNGMYTREILIPAGTIITGQVHKYAYLDIMLSGDIEVVTPDGNKRLVGHHVMHGVAGRKRAGYAHKDTRWITVHRQDQVEDMEGEIAFPQMREYKAWCDNKDYDLLLEEIGVDQEKVWVDIARLSYHHLNLPGVILRCSDIHGIGLFATKPWDVGYICPARVDDLKTEAGRYVNHSATPNCEMTWVRKGSMALCAIEPISVGTELTVNYRQVLRLHPMLIENVA